MLAWASLLDDDRDGAATRLTDFWADNAATAPFDRLLNSALLAAGIAQGHGMLPSLSPYQLPAANLGLDTFRAMLERHVDFDRVAAATPDRTGGSPLLLLGAVEVNTGEFRAFNSRHRHDRAPNTPSPPRPSPTCSPRSRSTAAPTGTASSRRTRRCATCSPPGPTSSG